MVVDQATSLDGLTYDVIFVLSTHKCKWRANYVASCPIHSSPLCPLGATYIVCVTIVFAAVFEKLYLYKVTYGTGRRSNVRKVSYKVEVMADEALLKKNEEVYGKYLPHEGNRMELHHQGDNVSGGG